MTTPDSARVAALKAQLAAISADLDELTSAPAGTGAPRRLTAEDGREAARRRHPGRTRSEVEADKGSGVAEDLALPLTGTAAGRAEARRRRGTR